MVFLVRPAFKKLLDVLRRTDAVKKQLTEESERQPKDPKRQQMGHPEDDYEATARDNEATHWLSEDGSAVSLLCYSCHASECTPVFDRWVWGNSKATPFNEYPQRVQVDYCVACPGFILSLADVGVKQRPKQKSTN